MVGSGNTPPTRVSSEGGGRDMVVVETPLRLMFGTREGVVVAMNWAGGVIYEKKT